MNLAIRYDALSHSTVLTKRVVFLEFPLHSQYLTSRIRKRKLVILLYYNGLTYKLDLG